MSLLQKWSQAIDDSDVNAMSELLHDDFEFTLHSAGKILSKQDVIDWAARGDVVTSNNRILYENDEVGVNHAVVTFKSDGNVQGVLAFLRFKDGKIWRQETGASNLPILHICSLVFCSQCVLRTFFLPLRMTRLTSNNPTYVS